jgi:ribA/ribD-fused uncharacterized protein
MNDNAIVGFNGDYRFLSNFYSAPITYILGNTEIITFPTSEHFYQAMKVRGDVNRQKHIASLEKPGEAKRLGKVPSSEEERIYTMREALWYKFKYSNELKERLIYTHPRKLIESNTWGDKFWGVCNGEGQNLLGRLLMELRSILIENPLPPLTVFTAQYSKKSMDRLDITMKGQDPIGKVFAPPKSLVYDYKGGRIDCDKYSSVYNNLMLESYNNNKSTWNFILSRRSVTLVCFCKPGEFCHRVLLAQIFRQLGATYKGEIT